MRNKLTWTFAAAAGVLAVFLLYVILDRGSSHKYALVLPNAIGVVSGTPVQLSGRTVGEVDSILPKNDKAVLKITLSDLSAPLRAGTTVTVEWRSLLGERYLQLRPGPATNPSLPDGAILQSGSSQVVVEELLETLDGPTRQHLASMLQQLDGSLAGHQGDFNQTLKEAGPYVNDVGAVLGAVGSDGQAISSVLTDLRKVTTVLAQRRGRLSSTVLDLRRLTGAAAVHQRQLGDGMTQLPDTLDSVKSALDRVPHAVGATAPLLDDLRPGTERLPRLAHNLSPVLRELRPSARLLWPTLDATDRLLDLTPDFLDAAHRVLPELRTTAERAGPAVAFLRPYTPEIMGFLSGWGGVYSTYDSQGHMGHSLVPAGPSAINNSPNIATPGAMTSPKIAPGEIVNQPWIDATGSGDR